MLKDKENTKVAAPEEAPDIIDINIGSLKKQRFRINGDNDKILELNTSDLGIITRLSELYPKLQELADKAGQIGEDSNEEGSDDPEKFKSQIDALGAKLKDIDAGMREYIDELFDSNVSEICAPFGNMYDIVDGKFRYDDIIDKLSSLYATTIAKETSALKNRLAKKAEKYIPQDKKKPTRRSK